MDAAEIGTVGADIGRFLGLPVEDRHIDISIGQKHGAVRGAPDLLQAERLLVEGRSFRGILRRQCDMLDSRHYSSLRGRERTPDRSCPRRQATDFSMRLFGLVGKRRWLLPGAGFTSSPRPITQLTSFRRG